ncbi:MULTISPECIES: hypothetical protein [unclassified Butyrivibrio]|uniref:hypothetical protein n=1 Tax=unclassified Butyrivibrio TaxID=2639466 RepID=UPI0003B36218|nr:MULTISPECIES: hypothetical protein [unclassified Butyrivibrio]MDC7294346.1 hypothetical protein [Butyrivibrio sp. DSM 10294]
MNKVRFHLPGLRYNFPLNMFWISLLEQHPEYFREGVEIASFFGAFPFSLWNGGRLLGNDQCDAGFVKHVIASINKKNIPVRFTFTNPLIKEEDLADPFCNFCLKEGDNGMNEVLVFSPILEEYIRENYPSYKIDSTTCKEIKSVETLNAELEKDYKYVVLDYNMNNQWDLIEQLNHKDKLEVLINALCVPNCERRGDHYKNIALNQKIVQENRNLPPEKRKHIIPWTCKYGDMNCLYTIQDYPTFVSPELIWEKYVPMGINNFKIEGRTANLFSLIETYCFFMIKPEKVGEARLLLLRNLEAAKVIQVNKPRPGVWP